MILLLVLLLSDGARSPTCARRILGCWPHVLFFWPHLLYTAEKMDFPLSCKRLALWKHVLLKAERFVLLIIGSSIPNQLWIFFLFTERLKSFVTGVNCVRHVQEFWRICKQIVTPARLFGRGWRSFQKRFFQGSCDEGRGETARGRGPLSSLSEQREVGSWRERRGLKIAKFCSKLDKTRTRVA